MKTIFIIAAITSTVFIGIAAGLIILLTIEMLRRSKEFLQRSE